MNDLFGVPAHPLLVHAAVVFVPLAAIGAILIAVWPTARRRAGWAVVALALVAVGFTFLSKESGETLLERVPNTQLVRQHADLGAPMPYIVFGLFVVTAGLVALDTMAARQAAEADGAETSDGTDLLRIGTTVAAVVVVLVSLFATYQIVLVGHSGAKATWTRIDVAPASSDSDSG